MCMVMLVYDGVCVVWVWEGEDGARGRASERRVDARVRVMVGLGLVLIGELDVGWEEEMLS